MPEQATEQKVEAPTTEAVQPKFIVRHTDYMDENGRIVTERTLFHGTLPPKFSAFTSKGEVSVETPVGPVNKSFTFTIPGATNVPDAFAALEKRFEQVAESVKQGIMDDVTRIMKEQQQQIVVPGAPGFDRFFPSGKKPR
jgi:hypothetical protein